MTLTQKKIVGRIAKLKSEIKELWADCATLRAENERLRQDRDELRRFAAYQEQFGDESWELDALDPNTLLAIIQEAIDDVKIEHLFEEMKAREESQRQVLSKASERWDDVASFLEA